MKQFEVCENRSSGTKKRYPFLLIVQADFLDTLNTRVVAPLAAGGSFTAATQLNPVFDINGKPYQLSTAELAGVPLQSIGKRVTSLQEERDRIIRALDILCVGF